MRKTSLAAFAAATALIAPAKAQRPVPSAPAAITPEVAALRDAALLDDVALDIIEGITTEVGPRMAGTEAEGRARAWGLAKLTSLGFKNVRIETTKMHTWVRGVETAEVVSPFPQKLRLTALGS